MSAGFLQETSEDNQFWLNVPFELLKTIQKHYQFIIIFIIFVNLFIFQFNSDSGKYHKSLYRNMLGLNTVLCVLGHNCDKIHYLSQGRSQKFVLGGIKVFGGG